MPRSRHSRRRWPPRLQERRRRRCPWRSRARRPWSTRPTGRPRCTGASWASGRRRSSSRATRRAARFVATGKESCRLSRLQREQHGRSRGAVGTLKFAFHALGILRPGDGRTAARQLRAPGDQEQRRLPQGRGGRHPAMEDTPTGADVVTTYSGTIEYQAPKSGQAAPSTARSPPRARARPVVAGPPARSWSRALAADGPPRRAVRFSARRDVSGVRLPPPCWMPDYQVRSRCWTAFGLVSVDAALAVPRGARRARDQREPAVSVGRLIDGGVGRPLASDGGRRRPGPRLGSAPLTGRDAIETRGDAYVLHIARGGRRRDRFEERASRHGALADRVCRPQDASAGRSPTHCRSGADPALADRRGRLPRGR